MDIGTFFFSWCGTKMEVYVIISIIFWFIFLVGLCGSVVCKMEKYKNNTGAVTKGVIYSMIPVGLCGGVMSLLIPPLVVFVGHKSGAKTNDDELGAKPK